MTPRPSPHPSGEGDRPKGGGGGCGRTEPTLAQLAKRPCAADWRLRGEQEGQKDKRFGRGKDRAGFGRDAGARWGICLGGRRQGAAQSVRNWRRARSSQTKRAAPEERPNP
jgi:hypothetical protein